MLSLPSAEEAPRSGTAAELGTASKGDRVVAVEAMKMGHLFVADVAGEVTDVASVGAQVATDAVLARIEPDEAVD